MKNLVLTSLLILGVFFAFPPVVSAACVPDTSPNANIISGCPPSGNPTYENACIKNNGSHYCCTSDQFECQNDLDCHQSGGDGCFPTNYSCTRDVGGAGQLGCPANQKCGVGCASSGCAKFPRAKCSPENWICSGASYGQLDCNIGQQCGEGCSASNTMPPKATPSSVTCGSNNMGIQTAIGCISILGPNGQADFLSFVLRWAVGIGGGIAFLLILYAGFMIMTSAGNPERLKAGQELLTSAISGLILLIFSVFILKFIGVDILGLDQFGFGK